ncbi:MAG: protein kinase, partial [Proteobacteria bacterium]|nr:protein kinase [Pseudomonadota bacterium]
PTRKIPILAPADDGRWALLHALENELGADPRPDGLGVQLAVARASLDAGDVPTALREVRSAVEEIAAAADWLERATDDDPIDRRHSMRLLRELDREVLADNTLSAVLAFAHDGDPARATLARSLAQIEGALLTREARPELGAVAHGGLRIARLRALVRLLDGVRATSDADLKPRLAAVRQLMLRATTDASPLRRAVWAAMTRAGDALLRDGHAEITDLLLAWTMTFQDDDFAIVREASMVPEIEAAFDAYARLHQATWAASDPDDGEAIRVVVERIGELADALPPEQSPRVESVRLSLARLGNQLLRVVTAGSHASVPTDALDAIGAELGTLARRGYGARTRLGVTADDRSSEIESGVRAIATTLGTRDVGALEGAIASVIDAGRSGLPPAIAAGIERVLVWLARRPHTDETAAAPTGEGMLPGWVPLSRLRGGFYVVRPIGRGAAGSVLLAVRSEERARADRELVAIKVPDYAGGAARNLSEQEFESLFREEAGALLALPGHENLARFITFDASTRPKPILVMEFVRGINLERSLEQPSLDMARALTIVDDLLAGLDAMHKVQIAHLDVKPANVVLRATNNRAVLVDFGLAGRRLRPGCGSAHYGAAEVWTEGSTAEPFPADVYAAACVAFEVLTNTVLIRGDTLKQVLDEHFAAAPAASVLAKFERTRKLGPLAQLLRAAVARDPKRRPTAARLRAGFAAIAPDLLTLSWPIAG